MPDQIPFHSYPERKCLRCDQPMIKGFIVDRAHYDAIRRQVWCSGQPERKRFLGFLGGIKFSQVTEGLPTITYCCSQCGLLESYALLPQTKD